MANIQHFSLAADSDAVAVVGTPLGASGISSAAETTGVDAITDGTGTEATCEVGPPAVAAKKYPS